MTIENTNLINVKFAPQTYFTQDKTSAPADFEKTRGKLTAGTDTMLAKRVTAPQYDAEDVKYLDGTNRAKWEESAANIYEKNPAELLRLAEGFIGRLNVIYADKNYDPKERSKCEIQLCVIFNELSKRADKDVVDLYSKLYEKNENFLVSLIDLSFKTYQMSSDPNKMPPYTAFSGVKLIKKLSENIVRDKDKLKDITNISLFNFIDKFNKAIAQVAKISSKNKLTGNQKQMLAKFSEFTASSIDVLFEELKVRAQNNYTKIFNDLNRHDILDDLFGILIQDNIKRYDIVAEFAVSARDAANEKLKSTQTPTSSARSEYTKEVNKKGECAEQLKDAVEQKEKYLSEQLKLTEKKQKYIIENKPDEDIKLLEREISAVDEKITRADYIIKVKEEKIKAIDGNIEAKKQILEAVRSEVALKENEAGMDYGRFMGLVYKSVLKKFDIKDLIGLLGEEIRTESDLKISVGYSNKDTMPKLPVLPPYLMPRYQSVESGHASSSTSNTKLPIPDNLTYDISYEIDITQVMNRTIEKINNKNISNMLEELKALNPANNLGFTSENRTEFDKGYYKGFRDTISYIYEKPSKPEKAAPATIPAPTIPTQ